MAVGEERELTDKKVIADLLHAGYIEEVVEEKEEVKEVEKTEEPKPKKKTTKKK